MAGIQRHITKRAAKRTSAVMIDALECTFYLRYFTGSPHRQGLFPGWRLQACCFQRCVEVCDPMQDKGKEAMLLVS